MSDCHGHILIVFISYGGSSFDFHAFEMCDLFHHHENGLMKNDSDTPMHIVFGNYAYLRSTYVAKSNPYVFKNSKQNIKDKHKFYHSQPCVSVEFTCGMHLQRLGFFRTAMHLNLSFITVFSNECI